MSCTTSTRLCEASATARWNAAPSSVKRAASSMLASASATDREPRDVGVGGVLGRKLGGEAFDGALRVHDLGRADAGQIELHRERLGEQARIAARHPRAAALAHLDLGDAERFERAQRIARHDPADAVARRDIVLGAEQIAGLELLGKQRVAHVGDDLRRQRRRAAGKEAPARELATIGLDCATMAEPTSRV